MADHNRGADYSTGVIGNSLLGECTGGLRLISNNGIDDSGTESGEDIRLLKPEVIQEVQSALSRLEDVIPGLDPSKRDAVSQLVNSLQSCLKIPPPTPPNQQEQQSQNDDELTETSAAATASAPVPPPRRFGNKKSLRNRHTVGVTREELSEARKWVDETNARRYSPQNLYSSSDSLVSKVFRPVKFIPPIPVIEERQKIPSNLIRMTLVKKQFYKPLLHRAGYFMEPGPQNGILSYVHADPSTDRSNSDTSSLCDYDPSLALFTPEQSVQIAVHKAAINKQISREELRRRSSSEDGDISSGDEEHHHIHHHGIAITTNNNDRSNHKELSSAQRLLQIATDDKQLMAENGRYNGRGTKKMKMKRSNTIDIPKSSNFYDYSSDEFGISADEGARKAFDDLPRTHKNKKIIPSFEPKTENDLKFLAFLKQVNENSQAKVQTYNPLARGGKHWQSRFSTIKTAFEGNDLVNNKTTPTPISSAKLFWQQNAQHDFYNNNNNNSNNTSVSRTNLSKTPQPAQSKLPWTVKTEENGVVVGSLTVSKPGHINHFKHAAISAFKPIEKKQSSVVSPVSGSVKQIAAQKFSATPTPQDLQQKSFKLPQTKTIITTTNPINSFPNKNDVRKSFDIKTYPLQNTNGSSIIQKSYNVPTQEMMKSRGVVTPKFLNENSHNQKQELPFNDEHQTIKMWSYPKLEKKEPIVTGLSQFRTLEAQINKQQPPRTTASNTTTSSSYPKHVGRTLDQLPANPLIKKTIDPLTQQQQRSHNSNYVHYNNVKDDAKVKDTPMGTPSSLYNTGNIYNKLPFVNDHLPTVSTKNKLEMNDHDHQHKSLTNAIKPSVSRSYFSDINEKNSRIVHFPTAAHAIREKQRFSLPENKLIDQYKDTTSKSNESIDHLRPVLNEKLRPTLDLTSIIREDKRLPPSTASTSSDLASYSICSPYLNERISHTANDVNEINMIPQTIIIPDSRSCTATDSGENYTNNSPSNYLLSPEEPSSVDTPPQNLMNSPQLSTFTYSSDDRLSPNEILLQSQKQCISPQFSNYSSHSPQSLTNFERISPVKLTPPSNGNVCLNSSKQLTPNCDKLISLSPYDGTTIHHHQHSRSPTVKLDSSNDNGLIMSTSPGYHQHHWQNKENNDELDMRVSKTATSGVSPGAYHHQHVLLDSSLAQSNSNHVDHCTEEKAVSKVMGQAQCHNAVTINNRTKTRYDDSPTRTNKLNQLEAELKLQLQQSARQKALSPSSFPNVIQKSESWHQMVKEQMQQAKQAPPLPKISKAKSSHTLAFPKQFEAALAPESVTHKKITVSQYLAKQSAHSSRRSSSGGKRANTSKVKEHSLDDNLDNVDEVFESIFQESNKKRNSK